MNALPIIIEDAPDPDAPNRTIRRARVADPLRALKLTDAEWAAAERLRDEAALAVGYREDGPTYERVDWSRSSVHYTDTQMDALRNMALVSSGLVMSPQVWDVVHHVVILWCSCVETAERLNLDRETVPRRLRRGLEALGGFYG